MAALPYMQLYVADYLADTMHLSVDQHGAYMLLIMNYWQTGKPLPDVDQRLQCVCRTSAEHWQEIRPALEEFFVIEDGYWHHNRIDVDLDKVLSKSDSARRAAKKRHKPASASQESCERSANAEHPHMQTGCHTDTDTDTDIKTCASDAARLDDHGKSPELYSEDFNQFWKAYPSKKNKKTAALKFRKLRKTNSSPGFLAQLIEDVECRARGHEWLKGNGQFIPHAATYLNQERWNDPAPVTDITTGSNQPTGYKTVDERNREVALQWAAGGDFYDQQ